MHDDLDNDLERPPIVNAAMSRHAAEWGLASMLLGGALALLAVLMLVVNILMGTLARQIMGPSDIRLAMNAAIVGAVFVTILCGVSMFFGIRSLVSAYRNQQPAALGWAGTLVSTLGLILWIVAIVAVGERRVSRVG
jgi:NADH:ubiquinone oxidoreductase subunit H